MATPAYELSVGDTAELISGGPEMTVVKVTDAVKASGSAPAVDASVDCWWFAADKVSGYSTLCKAQFPPASLVLVAEKPVPPTLKE